MICFSLFLSSVWPGETCLSLVRVSSRSSFAMVGSRFDVCRFVYVIPSFCGVSLHWLFSLLLQLFALLFVWSIGEVLGSYNNNNRELIERFQEL